MGTYKTQSKKEWQQKEKVIALKNGSHVTMAKVGLIVRQVNLVGVSQLKILVERTQHVDLLKHSVTQL